MNNLIKGVGAAVILMGAANTAVATYVEGHIWCDTNNSGFIEPTQDEPLAGVEVQAQCTSATDTAEVPLPTCREPNAPYPGVTDTSGFYRIHVKKNTNLTYDVSLPGGGLPADYSILSPDTSPATFAFPMSIDDEFLNPRYIRNVEGNLVYTEPYVAQIDWLVSSATCSDAPQPGIDVLKEVSLNEGPYMDANSVDTAPSGALASKADYRITVTNTGTEALYDVVINDAELGITDYPLAVNPLMPGQVVVLSSGTQISLPGSGNGEVPGDDQNIPGLHKDNACTGRGSYLNTASATGSGVTSGTEVSDEDIAYIVCEEPLIDLRKQVSLDGVDYFDADTAGGPDVPVGVVGQTDAYYRFIVMNTGTEPLTNVTLVDAQLGINTVIMDLAPGASQVIESGETGFEALYQQDICAGTPGNKPNTARVSAVGGISGDDVTASNPANLKCIVGPAISVKKQVRFQDDDAFVDADTPETAPVAQVTDSDMGRTAVYRFIVENVGDEDLTNVTVSDNKLGISGVVIADLPVGASVVIATADAGFENLTVAGQCDTAGTKQNTVSVAANGVLSGLPVNDNDPAFVVCEQPEVCEVVVDQKCMVKAPTIEDKLCTDAISATTLRYIGPNKTNATVAFEGKDSGQVVYSGVDLASGVTILTKPSQNGFTIDAGMGEKLGSKTTITINGVEEIIHTSCSAIYVAGAPAPLDGNTPNPDNAEKGDPSPNWVVVDFREKDDDYVAEAPVMSEAADSCEIPFEGAEVAFSYTITNQGDTVVNLDSVSDALLGEILKNPPVSLGVGESVTYTSDPYALTDSLTNSVNVLASASGNASVSCPAGDSVDIVRASAPELSCEDGKPARLGITYVGGSCADSNHDQESGKASCSGDSTGANPVRLTLEDKKGNVYISQVVTLGETLILDAAALGKDKLDSETNAYIEDGSGLIQSINFHTSCSAPLSVGDQHGGLLISSFMPSEDGKGKGKGKDKDKGKGKGKDKKDKKDKKGKKDKKDKKHDKGKKGKKHKK
ncbi:MAG: hypothetical protein R3208_14560 [Ketobacteraceae bacterium]|nr:hypothetical protein [Ketobacteraceae bacterium]